MDIPVEKIKNELYGHFASALLFPDLKGKLWGSRYLLEYICYKIESIEQPDGWKQGFTLKEEIQFLHNKNVLPTDVYNAMELIREKGYIGIHYQAIQKPVDGYRDTVIESLRCLMDWFGENYLNAKELYYEYANRIAMYNSSKYIPNVENIVARLNSSHDVSKHLRIVFGPSIREPLYVNQGKLPLPDELQALAKRKAESFPERQQTDDPCAATLTKPDWNENPPVIKYYAGRYSEFLALQESGTYAGMITANVLLFSSEEKCVLVHERSSHSRTYPDFLHTFGGGFMPEGIDLKYDQGKVKQAGIREVSEETAVATGTLEHRIRVLIDEPNEQFIQLAFLGENLTKSQVDSMKANWEGKIKRLEFNELKEYLIDYEKWVPSGWVHIILWLALDAPGTDESLRFNGLTGPELADYVLFSLEKSALIRTEKPNIISTGDAPDAKRNIANIGEIVEKDTWESAFDSLDHLTKYGSNALALFALELKFRIDDIETVASESITDGSDDKKCDIIYIDKDYARAVVVQCYQSSKRKSEAPANKASDLNTAVGWLLQRPIDELPNKIKPSAEELRSAIVDGQITTLHIWYVHNLSESENVRDELKTVEATASAALKLHYSESKINVDVLEVGRYLLETWYKDTLSPILVNDVQSLKVKSGFEVEHGDWKSFVTILPAQWLHRQFKRYGTKLFSANVREYLGSKNSDSNINYGIKKSAEDTPGNFWVFNNGLTILVNSYYYDRGSNSLKINGISIVNGAQTTGAIGSLKKKPSEDMMVQARFVQTKDRELITRIIQYNNSQNKIAAADFRSTDSIQKRLKAEFNVIKNADYEGGRRGGFSDSIRRNKYILPSYTVGQALAALHRDPVTAYNGKSRIWIQDSTYSKYFNESTTGIHIVFAYSLLRAVEEKKQQIIEKSKKGESHLTDVEIKTLHYFRNRGSTFLLVAAISHCLESILGKKIHNLFRLSFDKNCTPKEAVAFWMPVIEVSTVFVSQLQDAFKDGLKSTTKIEEPIIKFTSMFAAINMTNPEQFASFRKLIKLKT